MLQLTPQSKIFIATQSIDGRKGINGLVATCRQKLNYEPLNGAMFVFRNKNKNTIKILCYDGQGFWLCIKRLSQKKFTWWPNDSNVASVLSYRELQILLNNGNPTKVKFPQDWKPLID